MPNYMVERTLPGYSVEQVAGAADRARKITAVMTGEGTPVRYLRSTFIPGEDKCYCLFDGPSPDIVQTANDRAGLPVDRIVEVVLVASEDLA